MGSKTSPGPYDCYQKLDPDEPYFVLRGKDPIGGDLTDVWRYTRAGDFRGALRALLNAFEAIDASDRSPLPLDNRKSIEAAQCAARMRAWCKKLAEQKETQAPPKRELL